MLDVAWHPPVDGVPLQVLSWRELVGRVSPSILAAPQRIRFHLAVLCTAGVGAPAVDFISADLAPGRLLYVEPGQVVHWDVHADYDARLALFVGSDVRVRNWPEGPLVRELVGSAVDEAHEVLDIAEVELRSSRTSAAKLVALAAARDLLSVRLGLMDAGAAGVEQRLPSSVQAFRNHVEAHLDATMSVGQRAAEIGFSTRTLARACREATGRSPKELSDDRIALEARRLLGQPAYAVGDVSRALGFAEPTNFTKFFKRMTGTTPLDWKTNVLGRAL